MTNIAAQVEYTEQCSTVYAQECVTVQEKVCREPELQLPPPTDNYGVPQVSKFIIFQICHYSIVLNVTQQDGECPQI